MHGFDLRMLNLAGRQHYVVTHDQLREFGSARQIVGRLRAGLLESVHESVYRVSGSPDTWHQRLLAACFATSGVSAVSFRAAAQMWALPGGEEPLLPRVGRAREPVDRMVHRLEHAGTEPADDLAAAPELA